MTDYEFDVVIIGAGPAGEAGAIPAAKNDLTVAVIAGVVIIVLCISTALPLFVLVLSAALRLQLGHLVRELSLLRLPRGRLVFELLELLYLRRGPNRDSSSI